MRDAAALIFALICALNALSCSLDDEDRCGEDYVWKDGGCFDTDTGADADADSDADGGTDYDPEQWFGAPCSCEGEECSNMGAPVPNGGTIVGCEDVPATWAGADKSCLRSYDGDLGPKTYYANGYCSLISTSCEGDELICGSAVIGDFAAMIACPVGTALVQWTSAITVASMTATIHSKNCAVMCGSDADCRNTEIDPLLGGEATQYKCIEKDGVKFCQDPRNLPENYTAQSF